MFAHFNNCHCFTDIIYIYTMLLNVKNRLIESKRIEIFSLLRTCFRKMRFQSSWRSAEWLFIEWNNVWRSQTPKLSTSIRKTSGYKPRSLQKRLSARLAQKKCMLVFTIPCPVKIFRCWIQNYATLCDKITQHYATLYNPRRYIAAYTPPYRRERPFLQR